VRRAHRSGERHLLFRMPQAIGRVVRPFGLSGIGLIIKGEIMSLHPVCRRFYGHRQVPIAMFYKGTLRRMFLKRDVPTVAPLTNFTFRRRPTVEEH
jgi:hypothetical protein